MSGEIKADEAVATNYASVLGEEYASSNLEQIGDDNTMAESGAYSTHQDADASMTAAFAVIRSDASSMAAAAASFNHADAISALVFTG